MILGRIALHQDSNIILTKPWLLTQFLLIKFFFFMSNRKELYLLKILANDCLIKR